MINPSGKRRRLRRPYPSSTIWEDGQAEQPHDETPSTVSGSVSTCQRCALPIVGDGCALTIRMGLAAPQVAEVCGPCAESLHRWMSRAQRDSRPFPERTAERNYDRIAERIADKKSRSSRSRSKPKASEVADSLISKRRARHSEKLDSFEARSRRTILLTIAGAILAIGGLMVLIGSAWVMINQTPSVKG